MKGVSKNQDIGKHSRKGLGIGSRIPRGFCLRKGIRLFANHGSRLTRPLLVACQGGG